MTPSTAPEPTATTTPAAALMSAGLPAGTSLVRLDPETAGTAVVMPTGMTEADARRVATAILAAHSLNTRTAYAQMWHHWEHWCAHRGVTALPADPLALCAYLAERAEAGLAVSTLNLSCAAIRHVHRLSGAPDPVATEIVRQVRHGLARTHGTAPRRLARPLTVAEIRQILAAIDRTTPTGTRDAAIILLGFASALRRSELVALTLADLSHEPAGLLLAIHTSKTDPEARGQRVAVAVGHHTETDPVAAVNAWLALRGPTPGPLFTRVWGPTISGEPIAGRAVARMLRARAEAAGLDGTRITAHSLRAGHATTAALAGVPLERIAAQTRHQNLPVLLERYIRPLERFAFTSSKDLGL
ncbi:site-specific integrase [Nocardioides terrisoli]|uniref:site-specific integrase n=1 Tax=Nocardioides terrisoli TaxID=3388267 RepID=UPI00287B6934|nr:site-specific integrase [Nocardioides marmorisolisilvae]